MNQSQYICALVVYRQDMSIENEILIQQLAYYKVYMFSNFLECYVISLVQFQNYVLKS